MSDNRDSNTKWYRFAPVWNEIVGRERRADTAPVHIVKPETGAIARVADPFASTLPRHTRRDMVTMSLRH